MNSEPTKLDRRKEIRELRAENASLKEQVVTLEKLQGVALIESLRAEAAERREDHMKLVEENHELRQQLAASQLEAKRLREALKEFVNGADECLDDGGWTAMVVSMEAYHICDEALSSPTSTEALDAYVAEKVKDAQLAYEKAAEAAMLLNFKVEELTRQRDLAVSELETIATGFDCDNDAHRYGTYCRKCEAEKALAAVKESVLDQSSST